MKIRYSFILISLISLLPLSSYAETVQTTANGISFPMGLKNWRAISSSYRTDNNTQRIILGNSIAIAASRQGNTKPWPQGSILAKLVWKNSQHPQWDSAIVPGEFVHSEIMIRDSQKYKATGGWGFARWKGMSQQPYGENESFTQECYACHNHAKDTDFVFTIPAKMP